MPSIFFELAIFLGEPAILAAVNEVGRIENDETKTLIRKLHIGKVQN